MVQANRSTPPKLPFQAKRGPCHAERSEASLLHHERSPLRLSLSSGRRPRGDPHLVQANHSTRRNSPFRAKRGPCHAERSEASLLHHERSPLRFLPSYRRPRGICIWSKRTFNPAETPLSERSEDPVMPSVARHPYRTTSARLCDFLSSPQNLKNLPNYLIPR